MPVQRSKKDALKKWLVIALIGCLLIPLLSGCAEKKKETSTKHVPIPKQPGPPPPPPAGQ